MAPGLERHDRGASQQRHPGKPIAQPECRLLDHIFQGPRAALDGESERPQHEPGRGADRIARQGRAVLTGR